MEARVSELAHRSGQAPARAKETTPKAARIDANSGA
jgi:hypothetical protein